MIFTLLNTQTTFRPSSSVTYRYRVVGKCNTGCRMSTMMRMISLISKTRQLIIEFSLFSVQGGVWKEWNDILTVVARLPSCAQTNLTLLFLHRLSPVHGLRIAHRCR